MKVKIIIIIGLTSVLASCSVNIKIRYKTKDIDEVHDPKLANIVLDIEEFTDKRKDSAANAIFFTNSALCKKDGKRVLINSEKNYKKEPVTLQINRVLKEHLTERNSFKRVITNKKDTADYYITGNLTKFYGIQDFSTAATIFAGVFAQSSGDQTMGNIIFEITELKIYNKKNQLVKNLGTFKREYQGYFPNGGIWSCIFLNVNSQLKEYLSELISAVETEIKIVE